MLVALYFHIHGLLTLINYEGRKTRKFPMGPESNCLWKLCCYLMSVNYDYSFKARWKLCMLTLHMRLIFAASEVTEAIWGFLWDFLEESLFHMLVNSYQSFKARRLKLCMHILPEIPMRLSKVIVFITFIVLIAKISSIDVIMQKRWLVRDDLPESKWEWFQNARLRPSCVSCGVPSGRPENIDSNVLTCYVTSSWKAHTIFLWTWSPYLSQKSLVCFSSLLDYVCRKRALCKVHFIAPFSSRTTLWHTLVMHGTFSTLTLPTMMMYGGITLF